MATVLRARTVLAIVVVLTAALVAVVASRRGRDWVDTSTLTDDIVVDSVLASCHAPLRGRMDRVVASVYPPTGEVIRVFAHFPDRLRVQSPTGSYLLLHDSVANLGLGPKETADKDAEVPADVARRCLALRALVDAAALGPLHRATACRRDGDGFVLTQPDGTTATMRLHAGSLRPALLRTLGHDVECVEYRRTSTTWLVEIAATPALGRCRVLFDFGAIDWQPDFFAPRTARAAASTQVVPAPGVSLETQSPTPILVEGRALSWVWVDDPGDWPGRVASYRPLHAELERQDQQIAGFPGFWLDGERPRLAAPFRARPKGPTFVRPDGWQVVDVPAGRWLVVYPPTDDLAARMRAGTDMLQAALRQRQLTARGPITTQPFFHLHEGEPAADKLAQPTVRMAVAVQ